MCSYAAMNGQLPALKYLHENGCPWERDTVLLRRRYQTLGLPAVRGG